MDEAQTSDTTGWRSGLSRVKPLASALHYLAYDELERYLTRYEGRVLGLIAFGTCAPAIRCAGPYAWVDMRVLEGGSRCELWTSPQPVIRATAAGISTARNDDVILGCMAITEEMGLEATTRLAYGQIFDVLDELGYPNLLRAWNYFPGINAQAAGVERYRSFNVGRHEAFVAKARTIGTHAPASCALGSRSGPLIVYFIAAREPGQPLENPRQVSAYRYPPQYGPRSPTFARAMLVSTREEPLLFISGTASIVGHETLHAGDAAAQSEETITNLQALLERARCNGDDTSAAPQTLLMKAYVRNPRDLEVVKSNVARAFDGHAQAIYLQADICRAELLVEVEGVYGASLRP